MKKRFLAALLCLCLLVGLVPGMGTTAFAASDHNIGDIVTFAGYDWYIIGTESEGVTAPEGCYTLFAKNNDFSSTTFRAGANQEDSTANHYKDSDLQKKMEVDYMDVATMVAINNLNMVTVMAVQAANNVITIVNGERMEEDMDGSMLDQYMGKECTISLFNEVGAIKGKLMDADIQWVKVDTKKGTQLINRNMVRNITFDNK